MTDRVFVDTNVFVYADHEASAKRTRAREVLSPLIRERRAVISTQIMQEYFAVAIRKAKAPAERARWRVEALSRLDVVVIDAAVVLGAIDLHRLHHISIWDALMIKCASVAGCARALTDDLNHGQTIDGVRVENPFLGARAGEPAGRYRVPRRRATATSQARRT